VPVILYAALTYNLNLNLVIRNLYATTVKPHFNESLGTRLIVKYSLVYWFQTCGAILII
jgi:hypothetical protein